MAKEMGQGPAGGRNSQSEKRMGSYELILGHSNMILAWSFLLKY